MFIVGACVADAVMSHVAAVEGSECGRRDVPRQGSAHRPHRVRVRPHQDLYQERENGKRRPGVSLFEPDRVWFYMQKEIIFPCDLGSFHKYKDGFDMHGIPQTPGAKNKPEFCDWLAAHVAGALFAN